VISGTAVSSAMAMMTTAMPTSAAARLTDRVATPMPTTGTVSPT
jgi:hypothetical protein